MRVIGSTFALCVWAWLFIIWMSITYYFLIKPFKYSIPAPSSISANDSEAFTITKFVLLAPFLRMFIGQNSLAPFGLPVQEPSKLTLCLDQTVATNENTLSTNFFPWEYKDLDSVIDNNYK